MSAKKLANFYHQLATMLEAGMPVVRSLEALTQQGGGYQRRLCQHLRQAVERGDTLSEAAARMPGEFPALHVNLMRAGERSGRLCDVLAMIGNTVEGMGRLRSQLLVRLIYPGIVLHAAIAIRAVVALFLPNEGAAVALGYLVKGFGPLYCVIIGGIFFWRLSRRAPLLRLLVDGVAYHFPVIGGVVRNLSVARFAQAFEALYAAGVGTPEAMQLSAKASGNAIIEGKLERAVPALKAGRDLAETIAATGAFSAIINGMIATGVESGKLDQMLAKVRETAEFDAHTSIKRLGVILPLIVYFLVVCWVVSLIFSMIGGYLSELNKLM